MPTLTQLPMSQLVPSKNNPRKSMCPDGLEGLADSIANDELLQNIIVVKSKAKKEKYNIVSGNRRFAACQILIERGVYTEDKLIPVQVMENVTKKDIQRIAVTENIQRENMSPLDEADAVAVLVQGNMPLEEISAQTGLSVSTIRRRMLLSGLSPTTREALSNAEITLAQAEALTVGTHEQQATKVEEIKTCKYRTISVEEIREDLIDEKPTLAMAMFEKEQYTGTTTSDLFGEEENTYFDDPEQFMELQEKAVKDMAEDYRKAGYWPVEIVSGHSFSSVAYRDAEEEEKGAIAIHLHPTGRVQVFDKIVKLDLIKEVEKDIAEAQDIVKKPKSTYSKPLCEYMAMHKSAAVQAKLVENPRIAKQVCIVQMMSRLKAHKCHDYFEDALNRPVAFSTVDEQIAEFLILLERKQKDDYRFLGLLPQFGCSDSSTVYTALSNLSDDELDRLHILLSTLSFGQEFTNNLDTFEHSLFNKVAIDLEVNMADHWTPDEDFLSRRNADQLQEIINETKTGRIFGSVKQYKKSDIVRMLSKHFGKLASTEKSNEKDIAAANWLPEAMHFPAINPDAVQDEPQEDIAEAA